MAVLTYIDLYRLLHDAGVPDNRYRLLDSYGTGDDCALTRKHDGSYSITMKKGRFGTSQNYPDEDSACRAMAKMLSKYATV